MTLRRIILFLILPLGIITMGGNLTMNIWIRSSLEKSLSHLLNCKVEIAYSSLSFWDGDGRIGKIEISNPIGGYRKPLLATINGADVNIEPLSLLADTVVIESIKLDQPIIYSEYDGANIKAVQATIKANLESGISGIPNMSENPVSSRNFVVEKLTQSDGEIIKIDDSGNEIERTAMKKFTWSPSKKDGYSAAAIAEIIASEISTGLTGSNNIGPR